MRILLLPLLIAGCTQPAAQAPSLLPRAIERTSFAEPERPVPVATPDSALDAQVRERVAAFEAAATAFERVVRSSGGRIARGAKTATGSDAWLDAQAAIGELGAARATADAAAADLEQLAIERAGTGAPPYPALQAAVEAAEARLATINATSARLAGG